MGLTRTAVITHYLLRLDLWQADQAGNLSRLIVAATRPSVKVSPVVSLVS